MVVVLFSVVLHVIIIPRAYLSYPNSGVGGFSWISCAPKPNDFSQKLYGDTKRARRKFVVI